jgi:hypothetical protein
LFDFSPAARHVLARVGGKKALRSSGAR